MSYLENFGVLTGIGVDVFEAGAGVFKPTREAESNTKNFESALLHWQTHAEFYVFFSELESKFCEKLDPESIIISGRSLYGLYKCHFLSSNIAEFRLHRWLLVFERSRLFTFAKYSDLNSKILEQERSRSLNM